VNDKMYQAGNKRGSKIKRPFCKHYMKLNLILQ